MGLTYRLAFLLKFAEKVASDLIKEALGIPNPDTYLLFHQPQWKTAGPGNFHPALLPLEL